MLETVSLQDVSPSRWRSVPCEPFAVSYVRKKMETIECPTCGKKSQTCNKQRGYCPERWHLYFDKYGRNNNLQLPQYQKYKSIAGTRYCRDGNHIKCSGFHAKDHGIRPRCECKCHSEARFHINLDKAKKTKND